MNNHSDYIKVLNIHKYLYNQNENFLHLKKVISNVLSIKSLASFKARSLNKYVKRVERLFPISNISAVFE